MVKQFKSICITILFFTFASTKITIQCKVISKIKEKPRIAIVSLYDAGYSHIGKYSDLNKAKYAKKHGYDIFLYHKSFDLLRPTAWSKILAVQKQLANYDWIFWTDADSLIVNSDIKLESFIDPAYDIILSREHNWDGIQIDNHIFKIDGISFNTGHFLIKNSDWSTKMLNQIWKQEKFINCNGWWEQAAFLNLYNNDTTIKSHMKLLPQRALNSCLIETLKVTPKLNSLLGLYQPGDFILHFYGSINKAPLMKEWSEKISQ